MASPGDRFDESIPQDVVNAVLTGIYQLMKTNVNKNGAAVES
jgi:hypothetical protein